MKLSYGLMGLGLVCCAFQIWMVARGIVVMPFTLQMFLVSAAPFVVGVFLEVIERVRRQ